MVGLFASLKWRLVTSRLRATKGANRAWTVVGMVVAVALLLFAAFGMAMLRQAPDAAPLVVTGVYVVQLLGWALMPLVAFGIDETVDPQRFALLPLSTRTLQRGMLVTSLVGYLPVANVIVMVGAVIGVSIPWWTLPIALAAAALQLLTCVVLSRALSTAMSSLMSSRRGRDLGVLVGFGLIVVYMGLSSVLNNNAGIAEGAGTVARILAWTPPGALATLPHRVATEQYGTAAAGLLIAVVFFLLVWWWWGQSLHRRLTSITSATSSSSPASASGLTSGVSATSVAATAQLVGRRDLLLSWRDPMRRLPWLIVALFGVGWPFLVFREQIGDIPTSYAVVLAAALAGAQGANCYGVEGSGLWLHVVAYGDRVRARGEVLGHAMAALVPGAAIVAVSLVVVTAIRGGWEALPAAAGMCLAALGGSCALAAYTSARIPYAMPQSRTSMFASSVPGQKGRTAIATLSVLVGGIVAAVPAGVCAVLAITADPVWGWVALLVGVLTGAGLLVGLTRSAGRHYLEHSPEILAVVSAGDRA